MNIVAPEINAKLRAKWPLVKREKESNRFGSDSVPGLVEKSKDNVYR